MEQVIGQANRDFHSAFHTRIIPQELHGHGGLASRVAKLPAEPAIAFGRRRSPKRVKITRRPLRD
jgi:hypothetical protein